MKRLAILGSTGSIGQQTLEVVRAYPHRFQVVALAAGKNADLLTKQVREFHPKLISLEEPTQAEAFQLMEESGGEVATLKEMATYPEVDMVVLATLGKVGLAPCLAALAAGKTVALANKEVLVMAGELVTQEASRGKATLIPIDSEHSAL
ncbi:MAG: 1-deoxy-D-xylulose-5-phosphate reductoisomerase, partial [Chloroflexi bacterium]|nr:1-deoxy-D-xylulose-5-phosphate reductoisomerase [Chloroflexota bacterium]